VPIGGQDFSQVLPKIKANEPDILLLVIYGQDPGSFSNQAQTAGLKAVQIGFEFTPDGLNASKGTYDSVGWTFAYDFFDPKSSTNPLAKKFIEGFNADNKEDPDFYAANYYENAFDMWELMRRIWKDDPDAEITGEALQKALETNFTLPSVYGGDETHLGTFELDPTTHSVIKREMGVFEYKDGTVTPKAFFNIGGADYRST
jgi:branched-chain amino acid transport system substrate-binding protein